MHPFVKRLLLWSPRVLSLFFAVFIGLLSLAVFGAHGDSLGLTISYLLPAFIILVVLVFAWKWELVGAITNFMLGIAYMAFIWNNHMPWTDNIVFSSFVTGPLVFIALLFLLSWYYGKSATE